MNIGESLRLQELQAKEFEDLKAELGK